MLRVCPVRPQHTRLSAASPPQPPSSQPSPTASSGSPVRRVVLPLAVSSLIDGLRNTWPRERCLGTALGGSALSLPVTAAAGLASPPPIGVHPSASASPPPQPQPAHSPLNPLPTAPPFWMPSDVLVTVVCTRGGPNFGVDIMAVPQLTVRCAADTRPCCMLRRLWRSLSDAWRTARILGLSVSRLPLFDCCRIRQVIITHRIR